MKSEGVQELDASKLLLPTHLQKKQVQQMKERQATGVHVTQTDRWLLIEVYYAE